MGLSTPHPFSLVTRHGDRRFPHGGRRGPRRLTASDAARTLRLEATPPIPRSPNLRSPWKEPRCPASADGWSPRPSFEPTATCRAASTTLSRHGSRPSRATRSTRSTRPTTDATFRTRAVAIKEERAELVKHHLDVLWHDYFKPEHLEKVPNLHELFWNANKQASKVKASTDARRREEASRPDRRDRRGLEGHGRQREDPRRRPSGLTSLEKPPRRSQALRERLRGPWRVAVTEASMRPAIEPGDWLLVDPTVDRWPRRGSVVVFREPDSDELAIKRVAAGPGDRVPYADGYLILAHRRGVAAVGRARRGADGGRARPADRFAAVRPGPRRACSSAGSGSVMVRSGESGASRGPRPIAADAPRNTVAMTDFDPTRRLPARPTRGPTAPSRRFGTGRRTT